MILNSIGHSVGQFFNVPSAVQGQERLHSSTYNQAGAFLFQDFLKKTGSNDFLVSLYSPIVITSVPGCGITPVRRPSAATPSASHAWNFKTSATLYPAGSAMRIGRGAISSPRGTQKRRTEARHQHGPRDHDGRAHDGVPANHLM